MGIILPAELLEILIRGNAGKETEPRTNRSLSRLPFLGAPTSVSVPDRAHPRPFEAQHQFAFPDRGVTRYVVFWQYPTIMSFSIGLIPHSDATGELQAIAALYDAGNLRHSRESALQRLCVYINRAMSHNASTATASLQDLTLNSDELSALNFALDGHVDTARGIAITAGQRDIVSGLFLLPIIRRKSTNIKVPHQLNKAICGIVLGIK